MWFATAEKVERKIVQLLSEFEQINVRVTAYEELNALHGRLLGGSGLAPELVEMRSTHDEITATLHDALAGIRNGSISFKEIAPQLGPLGGATRHFKSVLDQTDAAAAAGKAAFKTRFGS